MRSARLADLAALVAETADELDADRLSRGRRLEFLSEIESILPLIEGQSDTLTAELERLRARIAEAGEPRRARAADQERFGALAQYLKRIGLYLAAGTSTWLARHARLSASSLAMATAFVAAPAMAAIPAVSVGGTVVNPASGATETIVEIINAATVRTAQNHIIIVAQTVGDVFVSNGNTYTVIDRTVTSGRVTAIKVRQGGSGGPESVISTTNDAIPPAAQVPGGNGSVPNSFAFPTGVGDVNQYSNIQLAKSGGDGSFGAGVTICILGSCVTIGANASAGGGGDDGTTINDTITPAGNGNITTVTDKLPGIAAISSGGNGGNGGSGVGVTGGAGGKAGAGGSVTLTSSVTIDTTGKQSHGIQAQSISGKGGNGGTGYVFGGGGASGPPGQGGTVIVNNSGAISTQGEGAIGILAQSLGGNAGNSGGSYAIVSDPGAGSVGGNGGSVTVNNSAAIHTKGDDAYGIQAQSIGGSGGSVGGSGGIVAFGNTGGGGGDGGSATINALNGSVVETLGKAAHGLFAQSIGGGGGSGGAAGGLVAFGSDGSTAGNGGAVSVVMNAGSSVATGGTNAYGVFVESIGGGGGSGGASGGLVAVGGKGGSGGNGGTANVTVGGSVTTTGVGGIGVFAQSIGGGGGDAQGVGGLVAIGGEGTGGGTGGNVTVAVDADGRVRTNAFGAIGVFVQSIGGGGGNGSASGGIVALGGKGGAGGAGGTVTASNAGAISTRGAASAGLFVQSVGGGGGNGGDGGGLVVIGGTGAAASAGGNVTVTNSGTVLTEGNMSGGIIAQSVGGGGGAGGTTGGVLLTIGGGGGGGGDSGTVTINNSGLVATNGNDSSAILAQSIGGGGGHGGSTASLSAFAGVAIGGSGGSGGNGGRVDINLTPLVLTVLGQPMSFDPNIFTNGDRSRGIYAQSVGGGGGDGGFAVQVTGGFVGAASVAVGGSGGGGGTGGHVTLDGNAEIVTHGAYSEGILAQSVGGGGGAGGFSVSVAGAGGPAGVAISVGVGGSGAIGGKGGLVEVDAGGSIETRGDMSTGFLAQSVGGGGGSGGFNVNVAAAGGASAAGSVAVGVGGTGAGGGDGGTVNASFDGTILTRGLESAGALIQSVGGAGGNGGFNISTSASFAGTAGIGVAVGLGGAGGGGGNGSTVTGSVGGDVETFGNIATGVIVQSLGGGGGNGGFNISAGIGGSGSYAGGIGIGLGGSGSGGGTGGTVTGVALGRVFTHGKQSSGVVIQSAGGGGGNGGFNVSASVGIAGTFGGGMAIGLGGSGAGGGSGGNVTGRAWDTVYTQGDQSLGVLVQSVGGGGGNGAFNVSGSITGSNSYSAGASFGMGGAGGTGGNGGTVDARATSIRTDGFQSAGFLAQSAGGGGGGGAFNVSGGIGYSGSGGGSLSIGLGGSGGDGGAGSRVGAIVIGNVETHGGESDAITAQSMGGGGGSGGFNVSGTINIGGSVAGGINVGIGGSGGGGGDAGAVSLAVTGAAVTFGDKSDGILAQSAGGGGGSGAFNVSAGIAISKDDAGTIGVGVGGKGGFGGKGGDVVLKINEGVADATNTLFAAGTEGKESRGIVAQSIGGGGGNGGFNVTGGISAAKSSGGNIGVGVGGGGDHVGDSGTVIATINGDVVTEGNGSGAALIQSVGGGGGNGGFNVTGGIAASKEFTGNILVGVGGYGGQAGNGGAVTATLTSDIGTSGSDSFGLTVQSLGGGGGNGAFNVTGGITASVGTVGGSGTIGVGVGGFGGGGGNASTATATMTGDVSTKGDRSHAILVQSVGGSGGNGGFNVTGSMSLTAGSAGTAGFGLGGFGLAGGSGSDVTGTLTGNVGTRGDESFGAMLQSAGGSGGNGAFNVTGSLSIGASGSTSIAAAIGVGGFGGSGGASGKVTGTVTGDYQTEGSDSDGVIAQSLAGGGGRGGLNISGAVALSTGNAGTASIGIGGFGGGGGTAGEVNLTRIGDTQTTGESSDGVTAQSVGGGGGKGALNISAGISATTKGSAGGFGFGLGGFGGSGGAGGKVTLDVTGNVFATGAKAPVNTPAHVEVTDDANIQVDARRVIENGSNGVFAQSVGGGGGAGGMNITGGISLTAPGAGSSTRVASIGIGGFGGTGGDAGEVALTMKAPGATRVQAVGYGDDKSAVVAQSLGGSGGVGGMNISGSISLEGQLTIGVGGFGGAAGIGGKVTATVDADLFATGERSRGLLAQSVGGGGGKGGINISGGIGGLPGNSEPVVTFGVGGFGGAGNRSGNVVATQTGQVMVDGREAVGVLVQSVAGGGGDGALNISESVTAGSGTTKLKGVAFAGGLGGSGGAGADAGSATLTSNGNILINTKVLAGGTLASTDYVGGATGVLVQSVGGGGGVGGVNVTGATAPIGNPVAIGVGGTGGAGGDAGAVTVTRGYTMAGGVETETPGLIRTFGKDSSGLIAQSIGGGGGMSGVNVVTTITAAAPSNAPMSVNLAIGGSGGDAGNGSTVIVRHRGDIATSGANSDGIFAQSISKGGGIGNFNLGFGLARNATSVVGQIGGSGGDGGNGGDVSVTHKGVIQTEGKASIGIHAQSVGGGGGKATTDFGAAPFSKNEFSFTIGQSGGSGGTGGKVTVDADGAIDTKGSDSTAILAQSIGGGGGLSGSFAVGATATTGTGANEQSYSGSVSVGLDGGVSATGGAVVVKNVAQITTKGDRSRGIWAESVGGSGGAGGSATGVVVNAVGAATVAVGGKGGSGSKGGTVDVTNGALISTAGVDSDGIFAQSIGGGGGNGGFAASAAIQLGASPSATPKTFALAIGGTGGTGGVGDAVSVTATSASAILTTGHGSNGILAQSIGGGGGFGGATIDARFLAKSGSDSININVGGAGGTGESGGSVTVNNEGLIWTKGVNSAGISANSIGGGGGNAGLVLQITAGVTTGGSQSHNATVSIGGAGGSGGVGGTVSVTNHKTGAVNSGIIRTEGINSYGILAQSIGGGGGNSSTILSFNGLVAAKDSANLGLSFGSVGGSGNKGGTVTVANDGGIATLGEDSYGILAQSIGGGGGNGGLALTGSLLIGSLTSAPALAVGGIGGSGGDGGTVTVTNSGTIVTRGARAHGIVAQSIGGGGGNAGVGLSASPNASFAIVNSLSTLIGVAGNGTGGTGGTVTVTNTGDITVQGRGATAIKAESINGGGGSLAFDVRGITGLPGVPFIGPTGNTIRPDPLIVARLGSQTSTNMNAGKVTVNMNGTIGAAGRHSVGIHQTAIGGGGGTIDYNLGIVKLTDPGITDPQAPIRVEIALGAQGGSDNKGGDVDGSYTGSVTTNGDDAAGVLIQSIGGGGGRAILDVTTEQAAFFGSAKLTLGSEGATSSAGGAINRSQAGTITTTGGFAPGAIVQSIGGGGGLASIGVEIGVLAPLADSQVPDDTQTASVVEQAPVDEAPAPATGIEQTAPTALPATAPVSDLLAVFGQSQSPQVEASTPAEQPAGRVERVKPTSQHATASAEPAGGPARVEFGDTPAEDAPPANLADTLASISQAMQRASAEPVAQPDRELADLIFTDSAAQAALAVPMAVPPPTPITLTLGANGGAGLDGGNLGLAYSGGFNTVGDYSPALVLQSIGAGGGLYLLSGSFTPTITLGGSGGASGNGGNVIVVNNGAIQTQGSHSHGVFLQSIGGGGGAAFGNFTSPTLTLNTANSGNGGLIRFVQTGNIVVLGDNSNGVVAQSLGGGGGWIEGVFAGTAGGTGAGGAIELLLSGSTFATGLNSSGVFAQSLGASGGGNMLLTSDGMIRGGTGTGAGVRFAGGAANRIVTSGSISAVSGLAIDTGSGNDRIENSGLIVGNVDLGSGANAVVNNANATFIAFKTIDLRDGAGSSGGFTNSGNFLMGLSAPRFPIDLAAGASFGNQDANGAPASNLLYGARVINTVDLDGDFAQTASGFMAFDIAFGPYASDRVNVTGNTNVAGRGEVTLTWLENKNPVTMFATAGTATNSGLNIQDTLALDYSVVANTTGIQLTFNSNFGLPFLNRNERAIGGHMDSALTVGGSGGIGRLLALLGNMRTGEEAQYKAIFDQLNPEPFLIASVEQFQASRAFSAELFGCATVNGPAGDGCVWAQGGGSVYKRTGTSEYADVDGQLNGRFRTGFEKPLGGDWMIGGAVGYDSLGTLRIDNHRATADGDGMHAGLGVRYANDSGVRLSASLSGGWQWNQNSRVMNIFGPAQGVSDQSSSYAQANAEVAYVFGSTVFARPALRGSMTALRQNGFTERGLAGLGVESLTHTQWIATASPELTLGVKLGAGSALSVTGGGDFHNADRIVAPFRLIGANPAADPAMIGTGIDQSDWHLGAQLRIAGTDRFSLRLNYDRTFGEHSTEQSFGLDARLKF